MLNSVCCPRVHRTRRHGGMADASDSKSDNGNIVWVQVPLAAVEAFASSKGRNVYVPISDRYPVGIELGPQVRARPFFVPVSIPLHQTKAGTYMYRSLIGIPKGSSSDLKSGLDLFLSRDSLPHMTYISSDLWSELVFCFTSYRRYGRRRRPVPGRCMRSRSGSDRGFRRRSVHQDVPRRDASRPPVLR